MFRRIFGSRLPADRPHLVPPPRRQRVLAHRSLVCSFLLTLLLLLSQVLGNWGFLVKPAYAASASTPTSTPPSFTFQQYLKQGPHSQVSRGGPPAPYPQSTPAIPGAKPAHLADYAHLPQAAEPATMKPISQPLTTAFLAGSPHQAGLLDLVGSDTRLEVQVQPGSLDLSHATVAGGTAPAGGLTPQIREVHGHFEGMLNLLGYYQVQVVDSQGRVVYGIKLRVPVTFVYHYQPTEMLGLNLDPGHILLSWPALIATAEQAKQPTTGLIIPMLNDPQAHTLTGQSLVLGPAFMFGGDSQNALAPIPHLAEVQGNNGQLSYNYPLQVPPGVGGFAPHLVLNYSSLGPNDRHNNTSSASDVGDGFSMTLGSITQDVYPNGASWYFINGIGNVGDRLIATGSNNLYYTEHLSYLHIQQVTSAGGQPCFDVWDKSGTFYELGCTTDSLQYSIDSNNTRHNYQWDVDRIVAPNDGPQPDPVYYKLILISYLQDCNPAPAGWPPTYSYPCPSTSTIRDAVIKQITYGYSNVSNNLTTLTSTAGIVDFTYLAPFNYTANGVSWASTYNYGYPTTYNCTPLATTSLRCDDPIQKSGGFSAPTVMGTFSLMRVSSYVGSDNSSNNLAFSYDFTYNDSSFQNCTDPVTLTSGYCAGEHLLTQITPTIWQNGNGHGLRGVTFSYSPASGSGSLTNTYYDSLHQVGSPARQFTNSTTWQYLTAYQGQDTGIGEHITYARAYNNSDGTPTNKDVNGNITDDRFDALFCTNNSTCTSNYAHPDDQAWSVQVVTTITSWGEDSTALGPATTTFNYYRLALTGYYNSNYPWCYPDQYPNGENYCVGDNWFASGDTDWQDYYHADFRGFAQTWTLSPASDLTIDYYFSTEGWDTPATDSRNYNAGQLQEEEVYQGSSYTSANVLRRTINAYVDNTTSEANACYTPSGSAPYAACDVVLLSSQTIAFDGTGGGNTNAPWVVHNYSYDDYDTTHGLKSGYHNLLQDQITGTNLPTTVYPLNKNWSYTTNDQTYSGWTYYTVDKPTHSEIDDASGHIWQCQDSTYDEGSGAFQSPSAGWPTTVSYYSNTNCTAPRGAAFSTRGCTRRPGEPVWEDEPTWGNVVQ